MKAPTKKKVETPIPATQAKESLKVKTYVEKLELRIDELEIILEEVATKVNKVADRLGL